MLRGAVAGNPIHQSRHPLGYPDPAPRRIKITQVGMQQAAVVDRLRSAKRQLDEGLRRDRVAPLPVVHVVLGAHVSILAHLLQAAASMPNAAPV